jgi:membrane protein YqaA with SNARE-associated domain
MFMCGNVKVSEINTNCDRKSLKELLKNEARLYLPHSVFGDTFFDIFSAISCALDWNQYRSHQGLLSRIYTCAYMEIWIEQLLTLLALPEFGLSTVFVVSLISATLLPLGSEPVVFGLIKLSPDLFWPTILVATAGNTLGGAVDWWMGHAAHRAIDKHSHSSTHTKALVWLERLGPKACLLAWLPIIGDPLCAVAGWLKLPFWPCLLYMAIGKFLRYLVMTALLLGVFPGNFEKLPSWLF